MAKGNKEIVDRVVDSDSIGKYQLKLSTKKVDCKGLISKKNNQKGVATKQHIKDRGDSL